MEYEFILRILEPIQNKSFRLMKDKVNEEKAIDAIVKNNSEFSIQL